MIINKKEYLKESLRLLDGQKHRRNDGRAV